MNKLTHRIILYCVLFMGYIKAATATTTTVTTTTMPEWGSLIAGKYLLADYQFYLNLLPSGVQYFMVLLFMGIMFMMLYNKTGVLIPAVLMLIFLASFSFLYMPLGTWFFYVMAVGTGMFILYKLLS